MGCSQNLVQTAQNVDAADIREILLTEIVSERESSVY
jgi:hypothetical protein